MPLPHSVRRALRIASIAAAIAAVTPTWSIGEVQAAPRRDAKLSALDAFKAEHQKVIKLVKQKASSKKLQAEVDQLLDYDWLAQAALGGPSKYKEKCGARCDEFESILEKLIRENYLRMVRKAEGHPIEYVGQVSSKRGNAFKVKTRITVEKNGRKQRVVVAYVMHEIDGRWQVRDIITDDVSLAKTYRYQFSEIHKRSKIDGVIHKLEQKLAELASNR